MSVQKMPCKISETTGWKALESLSYVNFAED
jgi:hypothetical protein